MKSNTQLSHREHKQKHTKFPLSIIANDISRPLNVGSLFRICDALGVEKLYLCGNTPTPPNTKISKTSRSSDKHVDFVYCENATELVTKLKASGNYLISLEITHSSLAIDSMEFKSLSENKQPVCLILGSENSGVDKAILALSDVTTHIPMVGNNSSMNVVTAASIACYEITGNMKRVNMKRGNINKET